MRTYLLALVMTFATPVFAQRIPLTNGNFESGTLAGWKSSGVSGGVAELVREGSCFSYNNTQGLTFGGSFAANVHSGGAASKDSVGELTSDPFTAGAHISFNALSEAEEGEGATKTLNTVTFEARLLDESGNMLFSQVFKPNVAVLPRTADALCTGEARDAAFSNHIIDTSTFSGKTVRLQFRQHTNIATAAWFTLVDDVAVSSDSPVIRITVTGCHTCQEGGRMTVLARVVNPGDREVAVEVKAGGRLPDGTRVNLFGTRTVELTLEPRSDQTFTLFEGALPAGVKTGTWTVEGALLERELGRSFSRDARVFEVLP